MRKSKTRNKPQGFGVVGQKYRLTIYNYCGKNFDCNLLASSNQDAQEKAEALLALIANPDRSDFFWSAYKFFGDNTAALQEFGLEMRSLPEGTPNTRMLARMLTRFASIDRSANAAQKEQAAGLMSAIADKIRSHHWWALLTDPQKRPLKDFSNFVELAGIGRWEECA